MKRLVFKSINYFKLIFRNIYYLVREGKIVEIKHPLTMKGLKWIESKRYGIAYKNGNYEEPLLANLIQKLTKDTVFLDIGGHAGYISLFASTKCKMVYTFEPETENFNFINRIIALNKIENIKVFNCAVGKKEGNLFFIDGQTSSTGYIAETGTKVIKVTRIDDFDLENEISAINVVIKIDVEGFGANVLEGMTLSINKFKPVIFFETHSNEESDALLSVKHNFNYELYNLDGIKTNQLNIGDQVIALPI